MSRSAPFRVLHVHVLLLVLLVALAMPARGQDGLHVVVLGSSTAAGTGPEDPADAWVARYRRHLQAQHPGHRVTNLAVGGYTTYHLLPSGHPVPAERPQPDPDHNVTRALALAPSVIVINLPSNDAAAGYDAATQMGNYDAILAAAEAADVPVWVATTQPRNLDAAGRRVQAAMRDATGERFGGRALDFWTALARPDGTLDPRYDSGDGIHLNAEGHRLLFERVRDAGVVPAPPRVATAQGLVEGVALPGGVAAFRGIPYAAPPVRDLRWRPPQPAARWQGVRAADRFGPQCMQQPLFGDMVFRSEGMSEDCLYLNVWTPASSEDAPRPVLVYVYGGGFLAGDGSEPRYDGASMAREGLVVVTLNYRLGVFGFLAHPGLTAESEHGASGNYGLLDQAAALRWVQEHIAAFGGDPDRITIAGESAGSISVSALMASPLTRGRIAGAIGESGSLMGTLTAVPLAEGEAVGQRFAETVEAATLAELRARPASGLLAAAGRAGVPRFPIVVDGYLLPRPPVEIYAAGEQARVPLLLGWNSEEMNYRALLGADEPTPARYEAAVRALYGDRADEVLARYPAADAAEVVRAATDLAGDRFIGYSTWKWFDLHRQTGDAPVYRYYYAHPRPPQRSAPEGAARPRGAVHSAEIEYALGNLATNDVYAWTADDERVSEIMQAYFAQFVRTGDPNVPGLPPWPRAASDAAATSAVMVLDVDPAAAPARHAARYRLLDAIRAGE